MKSIIKSLIVFLAASQLLNAQEHTHNEDEWTSGRPDGHAPISVMGDHTHHKGEVMFSYRYMNMYMEGLQQGEDDISASDARSNGYMVAPLDMSMGMHMLGVMYAPSDDITLMAMASYITNEMDLQTGMNVDFTTASAGFGDLKLGMLYQFLNKKRQTLHSQVSVSIPTGSIDTTDETPAGELQLPYPMQVGSGTYDVDLGLTYLGQCDAVSWGAQVKGTYRFGTNDFDYRLGNRYMINTWFAYKANDWLSFSARVEGLSVSEVQGVNPNLNPAMVTTADVANSGGKYMNAGLGFNLYAKKGALKGARFGAEYALPIHQDVNGIQLAQQQTITLGLQYSL